MYKKGKVGEEQDNVCKLKAQMSAVNMREEKNQN